MELRRPKEAELFIWTDVDPAQEADFNRWYDEEHMEERVALPGFLWARRYRARDDSARRYLALYRTEGLETFTSGAYRAAFERQTPWSNINFGRMRNTRRRIMRVMLEAGRGCGGTLGLLPLPEPGRDTAVLEAALSKAGALDGVLGLRSLEPDPELSTPLPSEDLSRRRLETVLAIDTAGGAAAAAALRLVCDDLGLPAERGLTFDLLWELRSEDLGGTASETG